MHFLQMGGVDFDGNVDVDVSVGDDDGGGTGGAGADDVVSELMLFPGACGSTQSKGWRLI